MNYRHIFHAGNFGDVFKHALLIPLLRGMQRKEKGFLYVDTHAGLGCYDLRAEPAARTNESAAGMGKLWALSSPPAALREFVDLVRDFNRRNGGTADELRFYPGSPAVAATLRRPQDRLALSELHPEDFQVLHDRYGGLRGYSVQRIDAFSALRAHLPPAERRALVLIDPPYEDPNELARIHRGLQESLRRFPGGCYAVWYPIKNPAETESIPTYFSTLELPPTLIVDLTMSFAINPGKLNGCGLVVVNPPWRVEIEMEAIVVELARNLAPEGGMVPRVSWLRAEVANRGNLPSEA